jgi:hypothetical protein
MVRTIIMQMIPVRKYSNKQEGFAWESRKNNSEGRIDWTFSFLSVIDLVRPNGG